MNWIQKVLQARQSPQASDQVVAPPDQLQEETRAFWREIGKDLIRTSITPIDDAAKQITGVVTILEGLYINAIAFSKLQGTLSNIWYFIVYLAPIGLLLLSLAFSLFVFFPSRYTINIHSSDDSRNAFIAIEKRKSRLLRISSVFLILGVLALFLAILFYLRR